MIVNGSKLETAPVLSGIPQGTVLWPVLFVIYINDILGNLSSEGFLFADDTKIFRKITLRENAINLQFNIKAFEDWSRKWLLCFHPNKCHVLSFGKFENIMHTERYKICDKELEHVFEQKDLGVTVDSELTIEEHISAKIRVANAIVGLIRRSFMFLDGSMFKRLSSTLIKNTHNQGGPHTKKCINLLENVQIRATKLVDGLGDIEYKERSIWLNLPTLALEDGGVIRSRYTSISTRTIETQPQHHSNERNTYQGSINFNSTIKSQEMAYAGLRIIRFISAHQNSVTTDTMDTFKNRLDVFRKDEPIL